MYMGGGGGRGESGVMGCTGVVEGCFDSSVGGVVACRGGRGRR